LANGADASNVRLKKLVRLEAVANSFEAVGPEWFSCKTPRGLKRTPNGISGCPKKSPALAGPLANRGYHRSRIEILGCRMDGIEHRPVHAIPNVNGCACHRVAHVATCRAAMQSRALISIRCARSVARIQGA
jgi:hypothetical protein